MGKCPLKIWDKLFILVIWSTLFQDIPKKTTLFEDLKYLNPLLVIWGKQLCNMPFENLLAKYGVKHNRQLYITNKQTTKFELANPEIKNILMKVVETNRKD